MSVKSHRQLRHEIEHNELADWMAERVEALKPHATAITLGIVVVLALVLGSIYYFGNRNSASAGQWAAYFDAFNQPDPGQTKALESIVTQQPGSVVAMWATQSLGDANLIEGAGQLFRDRTLAKEKLDKAETYFKRVLEGTAEPLLVARAQLGLGKTYEALGRPDDALKAYEQAASSQADAAIQDAARRAVARLKNDRNVEFLAWFAQQKPRDPVGMPGGGLIPGLPNDLPERPDISVPGLGLEGIGSGNLAEPGASTEAAPRPGAVPPAPPAGESPAAEPKADAPPGSNAPDASEPGSEPAKPDAEKSAEPKADDAPAAANPGEPAPPAEATPAAPAESAGSAEPKSE